MLRDRIILTKNVFRTIGYCKLLVVKVSFVIVEAAQNLRKRMFTEALALNLSSVLVFPVL